MLYLLDTDTGSYAIRGASAALDTALAAAVPGTLAISAITRVELVFGLEKRGNPRALTRLVHGFMARVAVMPWDAAAADRYSKLRAQRNGSRPSRAPAFSCHPNGNRINP